MHEPLAASVAPLRAILLLPATAVIVPPPQLPASPFGVAITSPAGSASVKPTPDSTPGSSGEAIAGLLLVIVNESFVEAFRVMVATSNALAMTGGESTRYVATDVFAVPPE